MEKRAAILQTQISEAKAVLEMSETEGWGVVTRWIGSEIERKRDMLCRPDLDAAATASTRTEIWTLRTLLDLPKRRRSEVEEASTELKGLRRRLEDLHNRGYGSAQTAGKEPT
jgi:hypothetical protein